MKACLPFSTLRSQPDVQEEGTSAQPQCPTPALSKPRPSTRVCLGLLPGIVEPGPWTRRPRLLLASVSSPRFLGVCFVCRPQWSRAWDAASCRQLSPVARAAVHYEIVLRDAGGIPPERRIRWPSGVVRASCSVFRLDQNQTLVTSVKVLRY